MPELDLSPNNIKVSENMIFNPNGTTTRQKVVSFFVGTHGPFTLTYDAQVVTTDKIKADIKKQVDELLSIHELGI